MQFILKMEFSSWFLFSFINSMFSMKFLNRGLISSNDILSCSESLLYSTFPIYFLLLSSSFFFFFYYINFFGLFFFFFFFSFFFLFYNIHFFGLLIFYFFLYLFIRKKIYGIKLHYQKATLWNTTSSFIHIVLKNYSFKL